MSSRESVLKAAYKAPCSGQTSRLYQKRRFVTINKCLRDKNGSLFGASQKGGALRFVVRKILNCDDHGRRFQNQNFKHVIDIGAYTKSES